MCVASILDPDGRQISAGCNALDAPHVYEATTKSGVHYFRFSTFATAYRFAFQIDGDAPDPLGTSAGSPSPGTDPTCGTGTPVTKTGGENAGVVFAALKTGFRALVAWESTLPEIASVSYGIDGGSTVTLTDTAPRTSHVFLVDDLAIGRTFCFTTSSGVTDAFVLRNAMTSLRDGKYTLNLLMTAPLNFQGRDVMDDGLAIYGEKMYDATDGYVQPGQTVMLYVDPEHVNGGTYSCSTGVLPNPPCDRRVDVTFSYDSCAGGAACAPLDGIGNKNAFVMMNSLFDANPVAPGVLNGANEVGTVLVHELGHYVYGAQDLYVAGDCYDATLSLSIMGGSRAPTEFDGQNHRCPNQAQLGAGYVPTWTKIRQRFTAIPERTTIDEGPHGGGPLWRYTTLALAPGPDGIVDDVLATEVEEDDAGTGDDAPANHRLASTISPGILYNGTLLPSDLDSYRFVSEAGQAIEISTFFATGCPALFDYSGATTPGSTCELASDGGQRLRVTSPGGALYVRFSQGTFPHYFFGLGIDAPAPTLEI